MCKYDEAVLTSNDADISVIPQSYGRSPLQEAKPATVHPSDHIGVEVAGHPVIIQSVRFRVVYANKITVQLFSDVAMTNHAVDVSLQRL